MTRFETANATILFGAWDWDLRLTTVVLIAAILIGAAVIALTARWRKRGSDNLSASNQLAEYRALYLEGAISKDEFERLRALLGGELRAALNVPPPAAKPTGIHPAPEPTTSREPPADPPAPTNGVHPA
jgi:hypothetical protein